MKTALNQLIVQHTNRFCIKTTDIIRSDRGQVLKTTCPRLYFVLYCKEQTGWYGYIEIKQQLDSGSSAGQSGVSNYFCHVGKSIILHSVDRGHQCGPVIAAKAG